MVKIGWLPGDGIMADDAIVIEIILHMVGIDDIIVVGLMAGVTFYGSVVISIGVTLDAV